MPLTPADVRNKQFSTTRLRPGYDEEEVDAFLDEVCHTVNRLAAGSSGYWHDWTSTDMVIWDNWRMLHAVEGCDAKYERRTLRTTIKGDYGLGYFENNRTGDKLLEMTV